jgi:fructose-1-phosphate kinase PfkB-like protein
VKDAIDPTGCGNTFCGGFLVGWYKTRNLLTAALWGSVSASFSKPLTSSLRSLNLSIIFVSVGVNWNSHLAER